MTTNNTPAQRSNAAAPVTQAVEAALLFGDISKLTPEQKVGFYKQLCESVGLNPLTRPFDFMKTRDGKEVPYANKNSAEQLRKIHGISITIASRDKMDSLYVVTARAAGKDGRTDESTAAIDLQGLKGESLANALMKCETKAKRRVTLSYVGLGMLDESEVETIQGAQKVGFDPNAVTPPATTSVAPLTATVKPEDESQEIPDPEPMPWLYKLEIAPEYRAKAKHGDRSLVGLELCRIPLQILRKYPTEAKRPAFTPRDIVNIVAALNDPSGVDAAVEEMLRPKADVSFDEDEIPQFPQSSEAQAA